MTTIPGLAEKLDDVIQWAVAADLRENGFFGGPDIGYAVAARVTESDPGPISGMVMVSYPDGRVTDDLGNDTHHEPLVDITPYFRKWERDIPQNFERFDNHPEPSSFEPAIDILAQIASGLAAGGVTLDESGAGTTTSVGNEDLASYIDTITAKTGNFAGDAMDRLNGSYLNRLDSVMSGQHAMAALLGIGVAGETEVFTRLREDVVEVAEKAARAFEKYATSSGGSGIFLLKLAGAVVATIGLFTSNPYLAGVGVSISIARSFIPEPTEPPELELDGGSVREIHTNLLMALQEICWAARDQEKALGEGMLNGLASMEAHLDSYDFGTPSDYLAETDSTDLWAEGEDRIVLDPELREAAAYLDAVGDIEAKILGDLQGVLQGDLWRRNPVVGYGSQGHLAEWTQLHAYLCQVLQRSSEAMHTLAERMVLVSYDFERTEDQIEGDLVQLQGEIADPTPREQVRYGHEPRLVPTL